MRFEAGRKTKGPESTETGGLRFALGFLVLKRTFLALP
jgi:hypothetical protein